MQTAGAEVSGKRRPRARKGPRPITIILAVLIGVLSLVAVALPLLGQWPLNFGGSSDQHVIGVPTPASPYAMGLKVEKVGVPTRMGEGNQWVVTLKVTNMVEQPPLVTPTPAAPTPVPEQAKVLTGFVKVILYDAMNKPVGGGNGFVRDLEYGQSKEVDVVVIAYGDFTHYEAYPDAVTTDKDPVIAPGSTPNP
ncbi:MAG TPA: hypothetical protein VEX13_08635 [Chloroflexia bacterium]|nr:hypothetical protein [Chloroflexia bacterium]